MIIVFNLENILVCSTSKPSTCGNKILRQEWHYLVNHFIFEYLKVVFLCLYEIC